MFNKMSKYSKTSLKLLSFLAANPLKKMYGREIAKQLGISTGGVSQVLREFAKQTLVKVEKRGRMLFYYVNLDNPELKEFKVWVNISELVPLLDKLKQHTEQVYLYGSAAEGTDTEKSDYDLFIVTENKKKTGEVLKDFKAGKEIKAVIVNREEFRELKRKDKAFYDQVMHGKELWKGESELSV